MNNRLIPAALLVFVPCAASDAAAQGPPAAGAVNGAVVQPWEGERLVFCDAPELSVTLKVDSATAGATRFSMGTGVLAPRSSNTGRHRSNDEIIYFVRGIGQAVLGSDTVPVHPGTTLYVPMGLSHAFVNPTDGPLEFVWVVAPRGFEEGLRRVGVPPGSRCPAPAQL